jgi:DNA-binding SARP family transcriptional activator
MLNLHLFGSLSAAWHAVGRAAEPIVLTARPGSLLAYLALSHGQYFTRGELLATLWGERHESSAVGCFNTTLWRLRKAVERPPLRAGELIASDHRGAVGIPHGARFVLDVEEFERLVVPPLAKPIEKLSANDVALLREGAAYYKEDILAGFSDEWALREREKLRRHHLNALGRLMQLSTIASDHAGAIGYAQQILDRDMLREDIHCELMRLLVLSGQRAMALRQFERCRDALRRELAIQPTRETMALYQQIAEHAVGHDVGGASMGRVAGIDAPSPAPSDPAGMRVSDSGTEPALNVAELVTAARHHLMLADEQLQRTMLLVTPPSQAPRPPLNAA